MKSVNSRINRLEQQAKPKGQLPRLVVRTNGNGIYHLYGNRTMTQAELDREVGRRNILIVEIPDNGRDVLPAGA